MESSNNSPVVTPYQGGSSESDQVNHHLLNQNPFHDSIPVSDISLQTQRSDEFLVNSEISTPKKMESIDNHSIPGVPTSTPTPTPTPTTRETPNPKKRATPVTVKKERDVSASLKRERSENWQHQETKLLLNLWEKYYNELKKYKRNSNVWDKVAEEFRSNGFERKAAQCKSRVRVLMAKYKACFHNEVELPEAVDSFDYFDEVHRLITGDLSRAKSTPSYAVKPNPPHTYKSTVENNGRRSTRENTNGENSDDDDDELEHGYRGKIPDELYVAIQYLIRCEEREDRCKELENQVRRKRRQERLNLRADMARRRKERAKSREEEINKVMMIQNEMMNSLIEAIRR